MPIFLSPSTGITIVMRMPLFANRTFTTVPGGDYVSRKITSGLSSALHVIMGIKQRRTDRKPDRPLAFTAEGSTSAMQRPRSQFHVKGNGDVTGCDRETMIVISSQKNRPTMRNAETH
jgi:hypothetical protein